MHALMELAGMHPLGIARITHKGRGWGGAGWLLFLLLQMKTILVKFLIIFL
jgi:hypothetical protein